MVVGTEDIPTGENLILSASFEKEGEDPPGVATGTLSLYHGDDEGRRGPDQDPARAFAIAGAGLYVGRDSGAGVTDDYPGESPYASPAARSTGSRSTSAASRTSTSSARPRMLMREYE